MYILIWSNRDPVYLIKFLSTTAFDFNQPVTDTVSSRDCLQLSHIHFRILLLDYKCVAEWSKALTFLSWTGLVWVRIPLETHIFILNFSLPLRSEQVNGAVDQRQRFHAIYFSKLGRMPREYLKVLPEITHQKIQFLLDILPLCSYIAIYKKLEHRIRSEKRDIDDKNKMWRLAKTVGILLPTVSRLKLSKGSCFIS